MEGPWTNKNKEFTVISCKRKINVVTSQIKQYLKSLSLMSTIILKYRRVSSFENEVSDMSSENNEREMNISSESDVVNDNLVEIAPYFC